MAHGLDMRHRIVFFLNFFDFAGKFLLLAITFFSFGILRIREMSNRVNPGEGGSEIFSIFFKVLNAFFRRRMQKLCPF